MYANTLHTYPDSGIRPPLDEIPTQLNGSEHTLGSSRRPASTNWRNAKRDRAGMSLRLGPQPRTDVYS